MLIRLILSMAFLIAATGCASGPPPGPPPGPPAPSFDVTTRGGDDVSLASLHGKAAIIDFWAVW